MAPVTLLISRCTAKPICSIYSASIASVLSCSHSHSHRGVVFTSNNSQR